MAAGTALGADDLNVSHARMTGWRSGRNELLRELNRVPVASLALSAGEILYVPRVYLRGVSGERLADAAFATLKDMTAAAERDPRPGSSGALPYRFSSRTRYLAWLIGLWLGGSGQRAAAVAATGASSLREWQRREVLRNGPALVGATASLARARLAGEWIARFEIYDQELAETSLARSFGIDLQGAAAQVPAAELSRAEARMSASRLREVQRAGTSAATRQRAFDAEIADLCSELDRADHGWKRLSTRGRLLLLALVSLARTPARASQPIYAATLAAALASERSVSKLPSGPSIPATSENVRGAHGSAAEAFGQRSTPPTLDDPNPPPSLTTLRSEENGKRADEQRSFNSDPPDVLRVLPPTDEAETASVDSILSFQSDFAGLLFLLNAFVALGLYPDFASACPPMLAVSPLWLIDRIGVFQFASKYRRDPLHGWINANSRGGLLPRDWMVGRDWCEPWVDHFGAFLIEDAGRTTLWHPAGFPLADMPGRRRHRVVSRHGSRFGRRYEKYRRRPWRLPTGRPERWVACLAHFLDARIHAATGDRSVGLAALALPGRIIVDELEVSAHFSLDRHPLSLRVAGLDRNPAWQPAEGRSFRFHFS